MNKISSLLQLPADPPGPELSLTPGQRLAVAARELLDSTGPRSSRGIERPSLLWEGGPRGSGPQSARVSAGVEPAFRTAPSAGLGMSGTLASQLNALHAAADREMESLAKGLHSAAAARTGPLAPYGAHPRLDLDRAGAETPTGRLGDMDERGMATAMGHMASTIGRAAESADSPHRPRNARGAVAPRVGVVARDSPRASRSDRSTAATTARTGATTRARRVRLQHRRPDGGARTRCWRAVRAWKRRWGARGGS